MRLSPESECCRGCVDSALHQRSVARVWLQPENILQAPMHQCFGTLTPLADVALAPTTPHRPPACRRRELHQGKGIPPKSPIALRILSWRGATVAKSSATILVRFGTEVSHASIRASPTANPKNPAKVLNCCFGCENRVPPRIYRSQHVLQTDLQAVFNQPTWHHSRPIPSSTWLTWRGLEA